MKKILSLLLFCTAVVTVNAQIQRKKTVVADSAAVSTDKAAKTTGDRKQMLKELNLTKAQKVKLKGMRQDGKTKMDAVQNDTQLSAEEKKTKLKELKKQQLQNTLSVLNDEQKAKFKQMQKDKKQSNETMMEMEEQ
jgi:hypothetical protein